MKNKRKKTTEFEQFLDELVWGKICDWHDDNHFVGIAALFLYVVGCAFLVKHYNQTLDVSVGLFFLLLIAGLVAYRAIRWLVKNMYCKSSWIQARRYFKQ